MGPGTFGSGVFLLGGVLLLGGCATLESEDWAPGYPVYSRRIHVYERPYRNPDGLWVVYDRGPALYSVVRAPGLYWRDGYYYRKHRGHWERSPHHRGPWAIYGRTPPAPVVRHRGMRPGPDPRFVRGRGPRGDPVVALPRWDPPARRRPPLRGPGWDFNRDRPPPRGPSVTSRDPFIGARDGGGIRPPTAAPAPSRQIGGRLERNPPPPLRSVNGNPPATGARPAPRGPGWSGPPPTGGPGSGPPRRVPAEGRRPQGPQDPVRLDDLLKPGWPNSGL